MCGTLHRSKQASMVGEFIPPSSKLLSFMLAPSRRRRSTNLGFIKFHFHSDYRSCFLGLRYKAILEFLVLGRRRSGFRRGSRRFDARCFIAVDDLARQGVVGGILGYAAGGHDRITILIVLAYNQNTTTVLHIGGVQQVSWSEGEDVDSYLLVPPSQGRNTPAVLGHSSIRSNSRLLLQNAPKHSQSNCFHPVSSAQ